MNRRQLLKVGLGGGAVLGGTLYAADRLRRGQPDPGTVGTPTPDDETPTPPTIEAPQVRHADEYGTVVDVVAAGADPEGREPVNEVVRAHAGDDTLLSFRGGTFQLLPIRLDGYDRLGIAAAGEERPTFVPAPGHCNGKPYVRFERVRNLLLERVEFDFQRADSGGEIRISAEGDATIRDVRAAGSCEDQVALFRVDVVAEGARGLVEDFRASNRGNDRSLTSVFVGEPHAGEPVFRNCELRGFSDNGLYASSPGQEDGRNGVVHVEGGTYENNNIANVRLGSTGSTARGVRVVADAPPQADAVNVRGVRLRERGDQVVEDCDIYIGREAGPSFGGVVFHPANTGAVVRNTHITIDQDYVPALWAFPRSEGATEQRYENLTISGNAAGGFAALTEGRAGTVFRNCTIEGTGTDRGGLRFAYSPDCRILDCTIDVPGDPIVLRQSTAEVRNTTIRTPDGETHIDEMTAEDEDFTPR